MRHKVRVSITLWTERVKEKYWRATYLAFAQVNQYSENSLIKQRGKPRQTPLDFSLAKTSRATALLGSHCSHSVRQLCKAQCSVILLCYNVKENFIMDMLGCMCTSNDRLNHRGTQCIFFYFMLCDSHAVNRSQMLAVKKMNIFVVNRILKMV